MALIGNYSILNRAIYKQFGGSATLGYPDCMTPTSSLKNRMFGGFDKKSGTYIGYLHPMAYVMPMAPGSMSSLFNSSSTLSVIASQMYAGTGISSTVQVSMVPINAELGQVMSLVASGTLGVTSSGLLNATVGMVSITSLSISSLVSQLGGIFEISASAVLSISPTVTVTAIAYLTAEAGGPTPLSPEGLAEAVWNYLKENPTTTGSMKEVLEKAKQSADAAFAVSS